MSREEPDIVADEIEDTSPEGCGSHMPALMAIARFMDIRSVIEFGAGLYSTRLFLNPRKFPLLESLVTFEHDETWAAQVRTDDPRHTLLVMPQEKFAVESTGMRADFVFLDSGSERSLLISHCLTLAPIFAIHDHQEGQLSNLGFKYVRGFNGRIQTVFVSNTIDLSGLEIASETRSGIP